MYANSAYRTKVSKRFTPSCSKKKISKSQRLSNWEADVLSDGQKQYAATDAWACLNIYNLLQELKQTGNYEIAPEEKKEEHLIESDK